MNDFVILPFIPAGCKPLMSIEMTNEESDVIETKVRDVRQRAVLLGMMAEKHTTNIAELTGLSVYQVEVARKRMLQAFGVDEFLVKQEGIAMMQRLHDAGYQHQDIAVMLNNAGYTPAEAPVFTEHIVTKQLSRIRKGYRPNRAAIEHAHKESVLKAMKNRAGYAEIVKELRKQNIKTLNGDDWDVARFRKWAQRHGVKVERSKQYMMNQTHNTQHSEILRLHAEGLNLPQIVEKLRELGINTVYGNEYTEEIVRKFLHRRGIKVSTKGIKR